ncbi:hypothetical protein L226DRAFT_446277, partial [Lentinus tigrinus ALCF2SS1-7]|uniref:uncharacterized protein n=1 Tax=Lentinus tigrinus ALCF2SS1-7 TaxID=1328758 RepID=UPI001165CB81
GIVAAPGFSAKSVFTTPNADWVPKFTVAHSEITTYSDGRWGYHEYSRWPQEFDRQAFHLACIPRYPPKDAPRSAVLWRTLQLEDWKVVNCGVIGVGLLDGELLDSLVKAAEEAINRFYEVSSRASGPWRKQATFITICVRHTIDRLRVLPAFHGVIISLAAHVQRLTLELWGLVKWIQDIHDVVAEQRNLSGRPWEVLGAHTSNPSVAQTLHRAGIPVWFQQHLTTRLAVYEVVEPMPLPQDFSAVPAYPRLLLAKRDLSGALNVPGEWQRAMHALVRRQLCQSSLPALLAADDHREPPAKRLREGAVFIGEPSSSLGPAAPVFFVDEGASRTLGHQLPPQPAGYSRQGPSAQATQPSRRARARIKKREIARASGQPEPPAPRPPDAIPSRQFYRSQLVTVSPSWVNALSNVSPLPQPKLSVRFYSAPPWLVDQLEAYPRDNKSTRYMHHWLSIRTFCRMRLFDRTIDGRPLAISEWRDALYGDYAINESAEAPPEARVPREKLRHTLRENIRLLFGKANALPSYDVAAQPFLGKMVITCESLNSDVETQRRVIWDMYETNWRCEVLALDALLVGSDRWSQVERWEREHLVSQIWGSGSSGLDIIPSDGDEGRVWRWSEPPEAGWEACRPHLAAFVSVLARWPGAPPILQNASTIVKVCSPHQYTSILAAAVEFYVRTFVDHYGRLPVPP